MQRENLRKIIEGESSTSVTRNPIEIAKESTENENAVNLSQTDGNDTCGCLKQNVKLSDCAQIGDLIHSVVNAKKSGKTIVRLEFEFTN